MAHLPEDSTATQLVSEDPSLARAPQTRANTIDLFLPLLGDPPDQTVHNDETKGTKEKKGKGFGASIERSDSYPVFALASGSEWGDDSSGMVDSPVASPRIGGEMCPTRHAACGAEANEESSFPKDAEIREPSPAPPQK
ncbi:hypothetical protein M407DRAFT_242537 [Tulasnella calospora MUT 4182]|uniref:Uncharacterized protein n=1 Tax=Tulasnella calospora MUT 4182 TaxID=1051891 RepID=A0A0C3QNK8_9AGAM|nr:hypothetical protein M407DRAFT_242537 [Tulasnella calospora MUT 4182]